MIRLFRSNANKQSITTAIRAVVMLLLLGMPMSACQPEAKDVVEVSSDPEKSYTMKATKVNTLISDSGVTRYRVKAKVWLTFGNAKEPYSYFPEGIYVEKFDSIFRPEASIRADTAYYFNKKSLWQLIGNVEVESLQGEQFNTSELFWNQKEEKVYSDKYIRIRQKEQIITGIGFESNQNMTRYRIFNSQGEFPVEEETRPQPLPADSLKAGQENMKDSAAISEKDAGNTEEPKPEP